MSDRNENYNDDIVLQSKEELEKQRAARKAARMKELQESDKIQEQETQSVVTEPVTLHYDTEKSGAMDSSSSDLKNRQPKKKRSIMQILAPVIIMILLGASAGEMYANRDVFLENISGKSRTTNKAIPTTKPAEPEDVDATKGQAATGGAISAEIRDVSGIVENVMPAIVSISCTAKSQYSIFGYLGEEAASSGSGIIIGQNDSNLLVVTNNHVIQDASGISVQFVDEEVYEASVKGTDSSADLAVLSVNISDIKEETLEKIKIATLGDSDSLRVGEVAIAIGNALGYGQSVTVGYVSAKNRTVQITDESTGQASETMGLIQTDAAINPGNSGGALLNIKGEVIGINSVKYTSYEVEGMGYAIPMSAATPIINELMEKEVLTERQKGYLGIAGRTVSDDASAYNMPEGVYVNEISKGGAADKAGIICGDIITKINDIPVVTIEALKERVNSYRAGTEIEITFERAKDGVYEEQVVTVKLQGSDSLDELEESLATEEPEEIQENPYGNGEYNPFEGWFD